MKPTYNVEARDIPKDGLFIDIQDELLHHVNCLFGGRGTGKTFSILLHRIEHAISDPTKHKFLWLRDTETITKKLAAKGLTPPIEAEHPEIGVNTIKKIADIYTFVHNEGLEDESIIGYLMALSTFHNARGIDFSDVDCIVFDEFMAEEGTIIRRDQGSLWLNLFESINRNRELKGLPPVTVIFLSNTNGLYSEILEDFGLSNIVEAMQINDYKSYQDNDIWIEFLENKDFTEAKAKTLLYRLSKNTKFNDMALNNKFNDNMALIVPKMNLKGSKGLLTLDKRYTLIQLSNGAYYYKLGCWKNLVDYDMDNDQEAILYRYMFADKLRYEYIAGNMFFDSIYTQRRILSYARI